MSPTRQPGLSLFIVLFIVSINVSANGVLRNGIGSRAMSLGGSDLVFSDNPLSAMNNNPAALARFYNNELQFSLTAAFLDAEFSNTVSRNNNADNSPGLISEIAYVHSLTNRLTLGASVNPVTAIETDWRFPDPPGALGVTFGEQTHKSSFVVLRSALGLGYEVSQSFSIGASIGLLYNRNRLKAPYVFQSHPVLAGALGGVKVLSNLEADGFGVNAVFSADYKPADDLVLSLSYTTASSFDATGTIRGTAPLGIGAFSYDAEVETSMPQVFNAGIAWQTTPPLRLGFQVDWIDWSDAFNDLPLHLTNGNNAALNRIVGSSRIDDIAPLNWKDRFVYRIGGEYDWSDKLQLRAGYSFGESPVPSETLTPLTAAIMKHTIGLGAGYRLGEYKIDLAYQWDLPTEDGVGTSGLLAGEYNNSRTEVGIHWLSISVTLGK